MGETQTRKPPDPPAPKVETLEAHPPAFRSIRGNTFQKGFIAHFGHSRLPGLQRVKFPETSLGSIPPSPPDEPWQMVNNERVSASERKIAILVDRLVKRAILVYESEIEGDHESDKTFKRNRDLVVSILWGRWFGSPQRIKWKGNWNRIGNLVSNNQ